MTTEYTAKPIVLQAGNDRTLVGQFNGPTICSDGGAILLKQVEQTTGIIRQFASCFTDHRNPDLIDHTLYELIAQRVYALALGYEDLNDHDVLRQDLLLAALVGQAARVYRDFPYQTLDSWSRPRRVVGKAEVLPQGDNPRFVVTSLSSRQRQAQPLYEDLYCGRGQMENRIKEQQLYLFADRTRCATMRANQTRLWFSSVAYMLLEALRRLGLRGTDMAQATCQTIRLKLLKIGAQIQVTVRKVWVRLSQSYPYQALFRAIHENLVRDQRCDPLRC